MKMDDKPNGWRNQKELAEERRVEISKLCGELDSKDAEIKQLTILLRKCYGGHRLQPKDHAEILNFISKLMG